MKQINFSTNLACKLKKWNKLCNETAVSVPSEENYEMAKVALDSATEIQSGPNFTKDVITHLKPSYEHNQVDDRQNFFRE